MMYKWYFPPLNGGQSSGLNDSGVSYFASDPIRSVAKETIQDSIDAAHPDYDKVIVKFKTFYVSHNEIPDYQNLRNAFKKGIERWNHHFETKEFFEKGLEMLNRKKVPILAIQDYQTTGLSKIGNSRTGGWYALISASGVTEKSPTDGGSYGIGKNAPFAASAIRTVFYCTKNMEGEIGFQGVAKIPTITNENDEDTQGIGYYFDPIELQPIKDKEKILPPYQREEYGTDKFVLGFNDNKNWKERLIDEVVSCYLLAIYRETLEVHVEDTIINKSTLPKIIDLIKQYNEDSLALQYYEVLTSSLTKDFSNFFETDINTKEKIILRLIVKDGFKKKVGLHRSTGMKIFDKGHFHVPFDFSGVLVVEGERLNSILRKMEPPTHDKWDPNLYKENEKYGKKLIKSINKWINDSVKSLLKNNTNKDFHIKGIEELLPDLIDEKPRTIKVNKNTRRDSIKNILSKKKRSKRKKSGLNIYKDSTGIKNSSSKKQRTYNEKDKQNNRSQKALVSKINVFCTDPKNNIYSVLFFPKIEGELSLEIRAIGENGKSVEVDIEHAQIAGSEIPIIGNIIGPFNLKKELKNNLQIKINSSTRLALEVIQK